jgi:glycosyltransferase involved in cell wall biosynthesis
MTGKKENIKISVIIIARNEEKKIGDCLKSVIWADEVLVILDKKTTDSTKKVAQQFGASVIDSNKASYTPNRNFGLKKARGKWVLYVDADERVTPSLRDEIRKVISKAKDQHGAYAIPRKNVILGREMKHGGWWPDYVKRLYRKDKLEKWKGDLHEEPIFAGEMGHLENALVHIKHDNLEEMVTKTNEWSEIEAKTLFDSGHPRMSWWRFIRIMLTELWLRLAKLKGFLDGAEGIIYSFYQMWSKFVTYAKLWELQIKHDTNIRISTNNTNEY